MRSLYTTLSLLPITLGLQIAQSDERERMRRIRLLSEALQNQVRSECRHLRRLGISLHGMQMLGASDSEVRSREDDEEWLPLILDELLLLGGQEDSGVSDERSWTRELLALRRWLAEDWLRPDGDTPAGSGEGAPTDEVMSHGDGEGQNKDREDDVALVQRRESPWERTGRGRRRSPAPSMRRGGSRSGGRGRGAREAELRDARTNAHRPWRTASVMSANSDFGRDRPVAGDGRHPAEVTLQNGSTANAAIHAWHASLFTEAPTEIEYELAPHQRDNVRATLESMSARQQCQMLTSFLRMMSLLISEVADAMDDVTGTDDGPGGHDTGHDDRSDLMQRFLIKPCDATR